MKIINSIFFIILFYPIFSIGSTSEDLYFSGISSIECITESKHLSGEVYWGAKLRQDAGIRFLLLEGWLAIKLNEQSIFLHHLISEKEGVRKLPSLPENYVKEEIKGFLKILKCKEI